MSENAQSEILATLINKLTVKTLGAVPKLALVTIDGKQVPRADGEQYLARIVGVTHSISRGESDFGPFIKFNGDFEGINIATGEVFMSGVCMMPETVSGILAKAVEAEGSEAVEFAVEIWAVPHTTPTGYQYVVRPLTNIAKNTPVLNLKQRLQLPSLPAPTKQKPQQLALANNTTESAPVETQTVESVSAPEEKPKKK